MALSFKGKCQGNPSETICVSSNSEAEASELLENVPSLPLAVRECPAVQLYVRFRKYYPPGKG